MCKFVQTNYTIRNCYEVNIFESLNFDKRTLLVLINSQTHCCLTQDFWTFTPTIKKQDIFKNYHITPYNIFFSLTNQRPCHAVESTIENKRVSFSSVSTVLTRTGYSAKPKQQQYCTITKTNIHLLATLVSLKYTHLQIGWLV